MNNKNCTKLGLIKQIELLQEKMIDIGCKKGLNHRDTIKHSQQLDKLMNIYQKCSK